jgi:hypothetical protein
LGTVVLSPRAVIVSVSLATSAPSAAVAEAEAPMPPPPVKLTLGTAVYPDPGAVTITEFTLRRVVAEAAPVLKVTEGGDV